MFSLMFAGLLAATPAPDTRFQPETPPVQAAEQAVRLEDVTVTGRSLSSLIERFVSEVAAPNPDRRLARWDKRLCIGVANLRTDAAQYIIDGVSTLAEDAGLTLGAPGCTPNLIIVATDDGGALATELVQKHRRALRLGGSGMDRGGAALSRFAETDRPVRWWQVSIPTDSETGIRATRIPGECHNACGSVLDYGPHIFVNAASRLSTQIVDNLARTIVIVDVDEASHLSINQLAGYIAMVSLAQINPEADTSAYSSILNVFVEPDGPAWLTEWDKAYLTGLYATNRTRLNLGASRTEIASSIMRAHGKLRADLENED